MNKKVVDIKSWPTTVSQPSIEEVLEKKKNHRKKRINETKEKVNKIRGN
jgi:hypothetical protein